MYRRIDHPINRLTVGAMALAMVALAATAQAQRTPTRGTTGAKRSRAAAVDRTKGIVLGAHTIAAPGVAITGEDVDGTFNTTFGGGAGVMVGYEFTPTFSAFASLDVAKQGSGESGLAGSFGLWHFEVGGRANFPLDNPRTVPYVSASVGRRSLGARLTEEIEDGDGDVEEYDWGASGLMFGLGGGVQHYLSPRLALDGGVELAFGSFSHIDDDGTPRTIQVNGSKSVRLRFGVTWRPRA